MMTNDITINRNYKQECSYRIACLIDNYLRLNGYYNKWDNETFDEDDNIDDVNTDYAIDCVFLYGYAIYPRFNDNGDYEVVIYDTDFVLSLKDDKNGLALLEKYKDELENDEEDNLRIEYQLMLNKED